MVFLSQEHFQSKCIRDTANEISVLFVQYTFQGNPHKVVGICQVIYVIPEPDLLDWWACG